MNREQWRGFTKKFSFIISKARNKNFETTVTTMLTAASLKPSSSGGELDLELLLRFHGASSDDDDDGGDSSPSALHRRTVDEILNSPLSSPSPPSSPSLARSITFEEPIVEQTITTTTSSWRTRSRDNSFSSALSLLRSYSSSNSEQSSRPLQSLFGSVRPCPKPGAAFAAAAASSRALPAPHAAAIKSRLASSGSLAQISAELSRDQIDDIVNGYSEVYETAALLLGGDVEIEGGLQEDKQGSSLSEVEVEENGESVLDNQTASTEKLEEKEDFLQEKDFVERTTEVFTPATDDASGDENHILVDESDGVICTEQESDDLDSESHEGVDAEVEETVSDAGGDINIHKLVDETLSQLETRKAEKEDEENKLRANMTPLELAEELEKRQASFGLHWEEGAAAQPLRLEGIRRGPPAVGHLQMDLDNAITRTISSQTFKREHGSPQVLAVHMSFIAIGMSKGAILVFPSKYSIYSADNMDTKDFMLGYHGEKSHTPVTSMCFNNQGDLLLVGYGDGHLAVWDVQKATAVKVISGEHTVAVVHTLFLGQDSQVTRQFKAVTGDAKGLVLLHTFSVLPLLNRFSIKTQCLLDGQKTGTVLSASAIVIDDFFGTGNVSTQANLNSSNSLGSMMGGVVGGESGWKLFSEGSSLAEEGVVIFVTHQTALVVRLGPNVEVYEKFTKPDSAREGSMPYTAWKYTTHLHDSSDRVSWLVIAWDRSIQVAKLVKSEMKGYKDWNIDSAATGVAWLDDQMLVVLTLRGQLILFTKDGTEVHRTSFGGNGSGIDDVMTYHTHFMNSFGNPEKAYHNSVAVRGASVYILGPMHLIVSRLLPWKERIQVLQHAGDWMGALDMAMKLYDGQAHGVIDLPRTIDSIREVIMPYLVELLFSYVDEVFSYISVAFCNQLGKIEQVEPPVSMENPLSSEIEEQYARVGGVAVEFCVHIRRADILFDNIFSKFVAVKQGGTFLEILEPYILKDMLGSLPPEIMQALVEHYSGKGWLQRVEQCVLHMDISSLDFNQVVRLCRENGLYGALIYLFNRGLDDYRTPLEELLKVIQNGQRTDGPAVGYRMLVYLKYCFLGLAFPPGHGTLSPSRLLSVKMELLQFLLEDSKSSSSYLAKAFKSCCGTCPNICYLLCLDTESTLEVLKCAFQRESEIPDDPLHGLVCSEKELEKENDAACQELVQSVTKMLISILDLESDVIRTFPMDDSAEVWPSKKDLGYLLEFIAFLVTCNGAIITERVLKHISEIIISEGQQLCSQGLRSEARLREKHLLALMKGVPQIESNSHILQLCAEAQFHQACGFLNTIDCQYVAALDSYMRDVDEPIHAFAFINKMMIQLKDAEASSFNSAVISRMPSLVKLSRECTFFLVLDHFNKEYQHIITQLRPYPESLFLFLKTAIDVHLSGTLMFPVLGTGHVSYMDAKKDSVSGYEIYFENLSELPKLLLQSPFQITDDLAELYLELLCQYDRKSVLKFLETFESYRVEHCLRLCQEYGVTDAAAFLLERVGDVGSALMLLMTSLEEKFGVLVSAVGHHIKSKASSKVEHIDEVLKITEVTVVREVLHACIGLCLRNTSRLVPQESESLWFRLLDSFSIPLRRLCSTREAGERQGDCSWSSSNSNTKMDEPFPGFKVHKLSKHANILRRVFSQFVGEIIEAMVGYVGLPEIMSKLLLDNANQEFGDFKYTIMRMLGTYGYERNILTTAKSLIEDDTFYAMSLLKKGASHAYAPQDFLCCICGSPLSKESSTSGIRVFSCGHSTHLYCESGETESAGKVLNVGCPICQPKKNSTAKNRAFLVENGLFKNYRTESQTIRVAAGVQHILEPEILEKSYGFQQMSRFEILSSLHKDSSNFQTDSLPQLRLSPPAIYHEKVRKGASRIEESSSSPVKEDKPKKRWQARDPKSKQSINYFPLK